MSAVQLLDERLSDTLRKLDLLQLERRLESLIEGEDFGAKSFKEQLHIILAEELNFRQE